MKKVRFLTLLTVLAMLLCACAVQPEQPTEPTSSANPSETRETVANTETTETVDSTEPPAELSTAEDFEKFIRDNTWYWRAIGCIFEKPEEIPAWFYFYLGVGDYAQATGEELAFILDAFQKKNPNTENLDYAHEYIRLPVAKINGALSVLGVTVEDIQIPDRWVYFDKTDAYYFWVTDAYGVTGWTVTKVEKGTEGVVAVYWETEDYYWGDPTLASPSQGAKMVMTMQQMPDGTYRILSNVPQE